MRAISACRKQQRTRRRSQQIDQLTDILHTIPPPGGPGALSAYAPFPVPTTTHSADTQGTGRQTQTQPVLHSQGAAESQSQVQSLIDWSAVPGACQVIVRSVAGVDKGRNFDGAGRQSSEIEVRADYTLYNNTCIIRRSCRSENEVVQWRGALIVYVHCECTLLVAYDRRCHCVCGGSVRKSSPSPRR